MKHLNRLTRNTKDDIKMNVSGSVRLLWLIDSFVHLSSVPFLLLVHVNFTFQRVIKLLSVGPVFSPWRIPETWVHGYYYPETKWLCLVLCRTPGGSQSEKTHQHWISWAEPNESDLQSERQRRCRRGTFGEAGASCGLARVTPGGGGENDDTKYHNTPADV